MRRLSNRKIRNICDEVITILEQRNRTAFLCVELKTILSNNGYSDVNSESIYEYIPMFNYDNAVKHANAKGAKYIGQAWWPRLGDNTTESLLEYYPIKKFNFDDRIKFMKWVKEQYTPKQTLIEKWFKKIFKLIPVLLLGVTLMTSCNDAMDVEKCYENVQKAYPNNKVLTTKDSEFTFIVVIDSNNVMLVETLNLTNPNISSITPFN